MLKKIIPIFFIINIVGCSTTHTPDIFISEEALKKETAYQLKAAKSYKKKPIKRKYKELKPYQDRMARLSRPLIKAAKGICLNENCVTNYKVVDKKMLNAWADGVTINATPMIMDFLDKDDELSVVLAHEIAHNTMNHIGKKINNTVMGGIVDIAIGGFTGVRTDIGSSVGSISYSQSFENEADYVGVYILARAGFPYKRSAELWRKFSLESQNNIESSFLSSHPPHPERYLKIKKAIAEIDNKKAKGLKIVPNIKK